MKYKSARDLPQFAREYKTLSPSELAKIVLLKRDKKITPDSIRMWFKRHPDVYDQLNELIAGLPLKEEDTRMSTQEVLAELITSDYGDIKIRNLETVEIARKLLDLIEAKLNAQRGEPKRKE